MLQVTEFIGKLHAIEIAENKSFARAKVGTFSLSLGDVIGKTITMQRKEEEDDMQFVTRMDNIIKNYKGEEFKIHCLRIPSNEFKFKGKSMDYIEIRRDSLVGLEKYKDVVGCECDESGNWDNIKFYNANNEKLDLSRDGLKAKTAIKSARKHRQAAATA